MNPATLAKVKELAAPMPKRPNIGTFILPGVPGTGTLKYDAKGQWLVGSFETAQYLTSGISLFRDQALELAAYLIDAVREASE
jgi:hypothetical protein